MRKRLLIGTVAAIVLAAGALATAQFLALRPAPPSEEDLNASKAVIPTCNDFAFRLFTEAARSSPDENVIISSAGTFMSLAILLNGAGGETRSALAQALGVAEADISSLNTGNAALVRCLTSDDPKVKLSVATSLWLNESDSFRQDYLDTCADAYGVHLEALDFSSSSAAARINAWVSDKTSGRIRGSVRNLKDAVVSALINAAYFNGIWTDRFGKNKTQDGPFYLASGRKVTVPMMSQKTTCGYLETSELQALNLPYGNRRFSMYIFLPHDRTGLAGLLEHLTADQWGDWMHSFQEREVQVVLPRFKSEREVDLRALLSPLGLDIMFDPGRADFSSAVAGTVWIDLAKQNSFIEVNERGTEIAVSIHMPFVKSAGPTRFVVDHPFFYAIRDNLTQTILFIGTIADPSRD